MTCSTLLLSPLLYNFDYFVAKPTPFRTSIDPNPHKIVRLINTFAGRGSFLIESVMIWSSDLARPVIWVIFCSNLQLQIVNRNCSRASCIIDCMGPTKRMPRHGGVHYAGCAHVCLVPAFLEEETNTDMLCSWNGVVVADYHYHDLLLIKLYSYVCASACSRPLISHGPLHTGRKLSWPKFLNLKW